MTASTIPLPAGLDLRAPTGIVAPPFILLEGEEKAGKSYAAAVLTASDKVGASFWLDLNESAADEYGPIGNYQIIRHDGRWITWFSQLEKIAGYAAECAEAGEKPVVLIVDSFTAEWEMLKDWIGKKAATNAQNRKALAEDPNAEVKIPNHLWNEANAKHRRLMKLLMGFKGIVIITARGSEKAVIKGGRPVEGETEWKPDTQKGVPYDVGHWIRMTRKNGALLVGARSLYCGVKPGVDDAKPLNTNGSGWEERGLEWFIFDALRFDPSTATEREHIELNTDDVEDGHLSPESAKERARAGWNDQEALKALFFQARDEDMLDTEFPLQGGRSSTLEVVLNGRIRELIAAEAESQDGPAGEPSQQASDDGPAEASTEAAGVEPSTDVQFSSKPEPVAEAEPVRTSAPEPKETSQQKVARLAQEEAAFQAEVLGVDYIEHTAAFTNKDGSLSATKTPRALTGNRLQVIAALREQGREEVAQAYERLGDGFPILLDGLGY